MPIKQPTPVLFMVGPTAVGKSALALHLAQIFDGEIINADSRQIYRRMNIGTAKPSPEDRADVPHHLLDILEPDEEFSLSVFLDLARASITAIHGRGRFPIVVGGSGQYIWALVEGWQVPHVPPANELRRDLEERAGREGGEALHRELRELDPDSAARIDPHNLRRVIRALEIHAATGEGIPEARSKQTPDYDLLILGITTARKLLYDAIDRRVDRMLEKGLVAEVEDLLRVGYSSDLPSMSGIGYKQTALYVGGALTLEEAVHRTKFETHRFVRRQYTWFRPGDQRITWLEAGPELYPQATASVTRFLDSVQDCDRITSTSEENVTL